jgi:hypothetical protein
MAPGSSICGVQGSDSLVLDPPGRMLLEAQCSFEAATKMIWAVSLAPLGEGWTAAGAFTIPQSGSGPGEGAIKNLAKKTRNYGLAMQ